MGQLGSIHWKEFERFIFSVGCEFEREEGDHRIYWKKSMKRPIVIPRDKNLPAFIVRNNLRLLGISTEEFLRYRGK